MLVNNSLEFLIFEQLSTIVLIIATDVIYNRISKELYQIMKLRRIKYSEYRFI